VNSGITISVSTADDLPALARCHRRAFPKSLSSALGITYVTKMLSWYLEHDYCFLFYASCDGKIAGFVGGVNRTRAGIEGSASGMAQHSFREAVRALALRPWLLFHPEMIAKYPFALKNLTRRFYTPARKSTTSEFHPVTSLVVIGVDPGFRNKGIGSSLMREFENEALRHDIGKLLLTVRSDNETAIAMYLKSGWEKNVVQGSALQMSKVLLQKQRG
jgi:ribosomal protein S18 acetylase RimI-like enzyme